MIQTIEQAAAAMVAAGKKAINGKYYDPRKRDAKAYVTLKSGYSNATFADYVLAVESASAKKGGPSGEFCAECRKILETNRTEIAASVTA